MVTHPPEIRDILTNYVAGMLNGGTLEFLTRENLTVARCSFGVPAFSVAGIDAVARCNEITGVAVVDGTIVQAIAYSSAGDPVFSCSAGLPGSGCDLTINVTTIQAGEPFSIAAGAVTYSGPA
jgi:hypothetical protein